VVAIGFGGCVGATVGATVGGMAVAVGGRLVAVAGGAVATLGTGVGVGVEGLTSAKTTEMAISATRPMTP
jgi:hypothetical protein